MSHRDSRNRFVSTEDFINEVELQELLKTLTVDDDDDESIIQDTILTESDLAVSCPAARLCSLTLTLILPFIIIFLLVC